MENKETTEVSFEGISTREDVFKLAAQYGIPVTKPMLRQIAELEQAVIEDEKKLVYESLLGRIIRQTPQVLKSIEGVSDVLFTITRAVIVSFGVPLVLILLLFVEQQRVFHGIALFESSEVLAQLAAWSLVLLNLCLEFTIEYVEQRAGFQSEKQVRFSLREWAQRLAYTLGLSKNWKAQTLSPAHRYKKLLSLVTFSILILALAGSMKDIIAESDAAWYVALQDIMVRSDLSQMMTWVAGLLFASAAVLAAQGLSRYIAIRCVEIIENMRQQAEEPSETQALRDAAVIQYMMAVISDKVAKKNATRQIPRE